MRFDNFVCKQSGTVVENNVITARFETQVNFAVRYIVGMVIEISAMAVCEVSHFVRVDDPNVDVVAPSGSAELPHQMTRAGYVEGKGFIGASPDGERRVHNRFACW